MGKALISLLVISLTFTGLRCYSQSSVNVSEPRLEMVGKNLAISYDIQNSSPEQKFNISIEIKDENGNKINAKTFDGDLGKEVSGGSNKCITWNLEADNIYIDAYIFVQINARIISPQAPEEIVFDEAPQQSTKSYNRTGLILQSIAFPGLGLSRVTGKPHWLRGVAGYGCIAGSIILNRQATNTYNGIEDMVGFSEINEAYDKALQQDNISNILLFTSMGIWVTDFIWTLIGTSDLKQKSNSAQKSGFSLGSEIEPISNTPLLSFRYRF